MRHTSVKNQKRAPPKRGPLFASYSAALGRMSFDGFDQVRFFLFGDMEADAIIVGVDKRSFPDKLPRSVKGAAFSQNEMSTSVPPVEKGRRPSVSIFIPCGLRS
ncbi:hypothetical protein T260_16935 [Geobacillus thermopakistaniensis]|uniref:Uncharacterized protein n=1 Tax=Geobacillus thermopakistaniensis (strain MAS1) TaxID=1408282 RepID=A0A7U9J8A0_GEOTM|nr:hypothetical protein T260_16935 [Geobacillus sp. MAS1]